MSGMTLDHVLLAAITALVTFAVWAGKRYVTKDDAWKMQTTEKLEDVQKQRSMCVQEFALRNDVNHAWKEIREQGEQLTRNEQRIDDQERRIAKLEDSVEIVRDKVAGLSGRCAPLN